MSDPTPFVPTCQKDHFRPTHFLRWERRTWSEHGHPNPVLCQKWVNDTNDKEKWIAVEVVQVNNTYS